GPSAHSALAGRSGRPLAEVPTAPLSPWGLAPRMPPTPAPPVRPSNLSASAARSDAAWLWMEGHGGGCSASSFWHEPGERPPSSVSTALRGAAPDRSGTGHSELAATERLLPRAPSISHLHSSLDIDTLSLLEAPGATTASPDALARTSDVPPAGVTSPQHSEAGSAGHVVAEAFAYRRCLSAAVHGWRGTARLCAALRRLVSLRASHLVAAVLDRWRAAAGEVAWESRVACEAAEHLRQRLRELFGQHVLREWLLASRRRGQLLRLQSEAASDVAREACRSGLGWWMQWRGQRRDMRDLETTAAECHREARLRAALGQWRAMPPQQLAQRRHRLRSQQQAARRARSAALARWRACGARLRGPARCGTALRAARRRGLLARGLARWRATLVAPHAERRRGARQLRRAAARRGLQTTWAAWCRFARVLRTGRQMAERRRVDGLMRGAWGALRAVVRRRSLTRVSRGWADVRRARAQLLATWRWLRLSWGDSHRAWGNVNAVPLPPFAARGARLAADLLLPVAPLALRPSAAPVRRCELLAHFATAVQRWLFRGWFREVRRVQEVGLSSSLTSVRRTFAAWCVATARRHRVRRCGDRIVELRAARLRVSCARGWHLACRRRAALQRTAEQVASACSWCTRRRAVDCWRAARAREASVRTVGDSIVRRVAAGLLRRAFGALRGRWRQKHHGALLSRLADLLLRTEVPHPRRAAGAADALAREGTAAPGGRPAAGAAVDGLLAAMAQVAPRGTGPPGPLRQGASERELRAGAQGAPGVGWRRGRRRAPAAPGPAPPVGAEPPGRVAVPAALARLRARACPPVAGRGRRGAARGAPEGARAPAAVEVRGRAGGGVPADPAAGARQARGHGLGGLAVARARGPGRAAGPPRRARAPAPAAPPGRLAARGAARRP
ncbi:unnamed protein product, partial [Prorocentrum cordatum]